MIRTFLTLPVTLLGRMPGGTLLYLFYAKPVTMQGEHGKLHPDWNLGSNGVNKQMGDLNLNWNYEPGTSGLGVGACAYSVVYI